MAMLLYDGFDINENGHLTVGGYDTLALAEEFGTPLYVMNEDKIRENCRSFLESFGRYNGGMGKVTYASKALNCKAMCRIAAEEGLCLDVVSGGELYTALQAGFRQSAFISTGITRPRTRSGMRWKAKSAALLSTIWKSSNCFRAMPQSLEKLR